MADANSLTLADYALQSNSPLVQKISHSLLELGNVLQDIPLRRYQSLEAHGVRFTGNLATPGWRKINEAPLVVKSTPTPWQEQVYIMANNFNVDNILLADQNAIQDPWAVQLGAYFRAVTYDINDKFINNNHITGDQDAPVGLRWRLDNASTYGIPAEMKIDAAATDISAGANGPKLFTYIDRLLIRMGSPEGNGIVLYINEELSVLLSFAIKTAGTAGGFRITEDAFDRSVMRYKNATFRVIGRKSDQSTQIITTTEGTTGLDASSTYTSMYAVRFGQPYFYGWEFWAMEQAVIGPYLLTATGTQQQITVDYPFGFIQEDVRSIGRIYGIKIA